MRASNTLPDFNEGLGTVYERYMLNRFFGRLLDTYTINTVLEFPIYGMTGLTGINSFYLAQRGCKVTLADFKEEYLAEAKLLWEYLNKDCQFHLHKGLNRLQFKTGSFDLVWNFAALWWVEKPDKVIRDMIRLSNNLIVIFMPNRLQPGYLFRKWFIDRDFFKQIDEEWTKPSQILSLLKKYDVKLIEKGALDMPPWPDTAMPLEELMKRLGFGSRKSRKTLSKHWHWDIINYYRGTNPRLAKKLDKFAFFEKLPLPLPLKLLWAHHRYFIFIKQTVQRSM